MSTLTTTPAAPIVETLLLPKPVAAPRVDRPASEAFEWERFGNSADWTTFLVWLGCFVIMAALLAYDLIASILGL